MSVADDFAQVVAIIRGWGFTVVEWSGCYGRSNGLGWAAGRPIGHVNHHYVCSLNPDQSYIDNLVRNLASGTVVNWFADVHGVAYLIGTGPMNHAGTGNQSVLDRTRNDQPPPSNPASAAGSISGNPHYAGVELQHPGDSTPYPGPMLDVMVAINAAEFIVWGYSANRAIMHSEWSNRKIDLSAGGGVNSDGWSAAELRRRVAARMSGTVPDDGDWLDMATQAEVQAAFSAALAGDENLREIRRMIGVAIGGIGGGGSERALAADQGGGFAASLEHLGEVRRMIGVAIGYPPGSDVEHNLAQQ